MPLRIAHADFPRAILIVVSLVSAFVGGASVAAAAPYEAAASAQCSGSTTNCVVSFPAVPSASRLDLHYVACEIKSDQGNTTEYADGVRFYLQTKQNGKVISLSIGRLGSGQEDGTYAYSAVSQPVEFSVPGQQTLSIFAWPGYGGYGARPIDEMDCTINGDLVDAGSAAPFQMAAQAQCSANCAVHFPVAANQLQVTFAACQVYSQSRNLAAESRFYLLTKQDGKYIQFPLDNSLGSGQYSDQYLTDMYSSISEPVNFLVPAGQVLQLFAWPNSGYGESIDHLYCTVAGEPLP